MKVKDIMTKKVISVAPEVKIGEIAKLLFDNNLTGMPVINKKNEVIGIVTESDLISRDTKIHIPSYIQFLKKLDCAIEEKNDKMKKQCEKIINLTAKDIMTKNPICVESEALIEKLAEIFTQKRINPIPVVKNNKLAGIVSRADLIKLLAS
ncbi:MAG: hypothetical protein Athens101410_310 [Parcubacteria group bacterium Athens1014_10]|nr:MAG: hypothetical protein Athens101410_310 [Parcubacteria group bacterium Athens1014_10]TSD05972.1 MAG: hypothetical protein Athens071412_119 [Parcubacteria group bacterium Athens0714_12]